MDDVVVSIVEDVALLLVEVDVELELVDELVVEDVVELVVGTAVDDVEVLVVDDFVVLVLDEVVDDVVVLLVEDVVGLVVEEVVELVVGTVVVDDVEVLVVDDFVVLVLDEVVDDVVLLVDDVVVLVEVEVVDVGVVVEVDDDEQSRTQVPAVSLPPQRPSPQHTLTGFRVQLEPHRFTSQPTGFVPALPQQKRVPGLPLWIPAQSAGQETQLSPSPASQIPLPQTAPPTQSCAQLAQVSLASHTPFVQAARLIWHPVVQVGVPAQPPHVALPRFAPSHCSPGSITPLPHWRVTAT